jgi:predicted methyltransferase
MIVLDVHNAKKLIEGHKSGLEMVTASLDLGITREDISLKDPVWDIDDVRKIAEDSDSIYFFKDGQFFKAAIATDHYYSLFPTGDGLAPALMIDGILMHRVKETDPMTDARTKAAIVARPNTKMLDICTGIGYSTIACLEMGVQSILTIERQQEVIDLAKVNPWSQTLFKDKRVELVLDDAVKKIGTLSDRSFDSVLHDPPRLSLSPDLYTSEFYAELFRVLKKKGVLLHYVGSPGSKYRKRDFQKGIMSKLRDIGFRNVKRKAEVLGVFAQK